MAVKTRLTESICSMERTVASFMITHVVIMIFGTVVASTICSKCPLWIDAVIDFELGYSGVKCWDFFSRIFDFGWKNSNSMDFVSMVSRRCSTIRTASVGSLSQEIVFYWSPSDTLGHSFSGSYNEYFGLATDTESFNYLQLANHVSQTLYPETITIAEVWSSPLASHTR